MHYLVENMEVDLGKWVRLEYSQIASIVGRGNATISNVTDDQRQKLGNDLPTDSRHCWEIVPDSQRACLLDPRASQELSPDDSKDFDYVIFGGILGDHPPRDRTEPLRNYGFGSRRLGNRQMTTDTAVLVCHMILDQGKPFNEIDFIDDPEIRTGEKESVQLPFRYVTEREGMPVLPPGLIDCLAEDEDWDAE